MKRAPLVCNTGPLIALSLLDLMQDVSALFELSTTEEVIREWQSREGETPEAIGILKAPSGNPMLSEQLDAGEASVILAALENGIPNVLMDEQRGRKVARRIYGLNVIGTTRVLVELRHAKRIDRIKPYLDDLLMHGYWISKSVISWALTQCHEDQ